MAVRASCSDLIRRLRDLIGDAGSVTWTTDQPLQDALDDNQTAQRYIPLLSMETRRPTGWVYLDFYADQISDWEADAALADGNYNDITSTATLADLVNGHWAFPTQPMFPVYATGKTYDLFGAAADLLEKEAGQVRRQFDVAETTGAAMKRSQMGTAMLNLASEYRAKQIPISTRSTRRDTGAGGEAGSSAARWSGRGGWLNTGDSDA